MTDVWVFSGTGASLPSAVFANRSKAEAWISLHRLSGMLTRYPIDMAVYDWAIEQGVWAPRRDDQKTPSFIQRFTSAHLEHYHYDAGTVR